MEDALILVSQVRALFEAHAWIPLAALVIGGIVRLLKSDRLPGWAYVPARARPWLALGLGLVSGVLDLVVTGTPAAVAIVGGVIAAAIAVLGHDTVIEGVRKGKELGAKGGASGFSRLGAMALVALLFVFVAGCAWFRSAAPVIAEVVRTVKDFSVLLDLIAARAAGHPDEEAIARAIGDARKALEAAERASSGAEHLSREETAKAFDDFEAAYETLYSLLDRAGLLDIDGGLLGASTAAGDGSPIPTPAEVSERLEAAGGE